MTLLQSLAAWQKEQAAKEHLEPYKVAQFSVLKDIAARQPVTSLELLKIKGMGPVKVHKYGDAILRLVRAHAAAGASRQKSSRVATQTADHADLFTEAREVNTAAATLPPAYIRSGTVDFVTGEVRDADAQDALSVTDFVTMMDTALRAQFQQVRVRGEIVGFKRNTNGHAYFEIKDEESVLRCAVFRDAYMLSGIDLEDGMDVIITGYPNYHKRYGFSFIGQTVALAGEGALKKAYDALKKKLAAEGLLSPDVKRPLPPLPQRIGLITSKTGAAIGDFMSNVGQYGYTIRFCHASVEGANALADLRAALRAMVRAKVDVLVIVRGGGSLESLQVFNNETIVRMIRAFPVPVVVGVGHDQDETLATLVADVGVSTPTAAARAVRESWDAFAARLAAYEQRIMSAMRERLVAARATVRGADHKMRTAFAAVLAVARETFYRYDTLWERARGDLRALRLRLSALSATLVRLQRGALDHTWQRCTARRAVVALETSVRRDARALATMRQMLAQHDPQRQLALGYSLTRTASGKIVRSVADVSAGDAIAVRVADGDIAATVD